MDRLIQKLAEFIDADEKPLYVQAVHAGVSPKTLYAVLKGNDPRLSTVEALGEQVGLVLTWTRAQAQEQRQT